MGHLTLQLASRRLRVTAIEPNDAMRERGASRSNRVTSISWHEAVAEATGQPEAFYDLVTFGSSFNVTDRSRALIESHRILKQKGWFACLWNHRDINDPVQAEIEGIIQRAVPDYDYGSRREDQTEIIEKSGLFEAVQHHEGSMVHEHSVKNCIEAWRSHLTLQRQAGHDFDTIIDRIETFISGLGVALIPVPYTTRVWMARKSD